MILREDISILVKRFFADFNQERKSWSYLAKSCSRYLTVFCLLFPNPLQFSQTKLVAFREFFGQKHVTNQLFNWAFCLVEQDAICFRRDYQQVRFLDKRRHRTNGWSVPDGKWNDVSEVSEKKNLLTEKWQH